jgi:hypothetical protein
VRVGVDVGVPVLVVESESVVRVSLPFISNESSFDEW